MQTVEFLVPALDAQPEAGDLGSALIGLSGVALVDIDVPSHTVRVGYEPEFVSAALIGRTIERAGYPGGAPTTARSPEDSAAEVSDEG